jgi:hypothetical protein
MCEKCGGDTRQTGYRKNKYMNLYSSNPMSVPELIDIMLDDFDKQTLEIISKHRKEAYAEGYYDAIHKPM